MNQIANVVKELSEIYTPNEPFPDCTFIYGQKSVGKSLCVQKFLEINIEFKSVIIYAHECYHNKILFENIINAFNNHEPNDENGYESFARVDTMEDFLDQISALDDKKSYIIVVEKAERLRDMEINIIPTLLKLQEFTGLNISCIFISHIALQKFNDWNVVKIHVPDYNKNDVLEIMLSDFENVHANVIRKIEKSQSSEQERELEAAMTMDEDFYKNFLNIFLNVFYKACRDLKELSFLAEKSYAQYYSPVLSGEIKSNDVTNLWRNITKPLKASLNTIYMRVGNLPAIAATENKEREMNEFDEASDNIVRVNSVKTFAQMLELPFYAKYLLIASFLASHNDAKSDKKLFMKHHGKERKRNIKPKVSEKLNVQFGPKSFTIDRLLAIFYAILDEKVGLTCNLLSQISTLVDLNFLTYTSGENNIMEGTARLQSTIGLDFAINIGKVVGFNVKQYLTDFH